METVREVLADCESEQVRALIEEHNKMAIIVRQLAEMNNIGNADLLPKTIFARR